MDDQAEVLHADALACVSIAEASFLEGHYNIPCLAWCHHTGFEFITVEKQGFIPISSKSIIDRLNIIM